jgi:hypothetical protein
MEVPGLMPAGHMLETHQCKACGATEPDSFNMGKHAGGESCKRICLQMSHAISVLETYLHWSKNPDGIHCCAFRYNLDHPRGQSWPQGAPTHDQMREHIQTAWTAAARAWSLRLDDLRLHTLNYAIRIGSHTVELDYLEEMVGTNDATRI